MIPSLTSRLISLAHVSSTISLIATKSPKDERASLLRARIKARAEAELSISNSGLISFTGQFVEGYEWPVRVWIFFLMSSFILAIKYLVAAIIPDTPYEIIIQQERNVYYLEKVIENRKDLPDAIDSSALRVRPNFRLKLGDDDPL